MAGAMRVEKKKIDERRGSPARLTSALLPSTPSLSLMIPPVVAARAWRASHGYLDNTAWPGVADEGDGGGDGGGATTTAPGGGAWWETISSSGQAAFLAGGRAEESGGGGRGGGGCGSRPQALFPAAERVRTGRDGK